MDTCTLSLVATSPCSKGSESVKMKRKKANNIPSRGKSADTGLFFFFFRGGEFKSALIIDAIYKDKQEIIFLISCFSSAAPEIGGLIFIE